MALEQTPGFSAQNRQLPGTYINFISTTTASAALHERGVAAVGLALDWGQNDELMILDRKAFESGLLSLTGHLATDEAMLPIRELFRCASSVMLYRTDTGGTAAVCNLATARYGGIFGNRLSIRVTVPAGGNPNMVVTTLLNGETVDEQSVIGAAALIDNDFVCFHNTAQLTAGLYPLSGGTNGTEGVTGHTAFLAALEQTGANAVGYAGQDENIRSLYIAFARRMREENGMKCQAVLYRCAADYEGIVSAYNTATGDTPGALVWWLTGVIAGEAVNHSSMNRIYDGECAFTSAPSRAECRTATAAGHMLLCLMAGEYRILRDQNTLVTLTATKGELFRSNQTIRVIDQIANDTGVLFREKYMGTCPNDNAGRISLWTDIVKQHKLLLDMRAIEAFDDSDIRISRGESAGSVVISDCVTVVNAMEKLYMTCYID